MDVLLTVNADTDVAEEVRWWRENRPDAPELVADELASAYQHLAQHATTLPIFRRIGARRVRRLGLPKTHVYFVVEKGRVVVLAVWGSVRGILPALRARGARLP